MGKISGKSLADNYQNFQNPCVKVMASGKEIPAGDGVYLERTEVISSTGMEPDMAVLIYRADKFSGQNLMQMEKYLDVGQKMEVQAGYGDNTSRIFLGYLHEVEAADFMQDYVEYTLVCLDVKGLMKKNSVYQVSGSKKVQQILNEILSSECYRDFIEEKKVDPLPEALNQDCMIKGETHYDWLCSLAARMDYEFICGRGQVLFQNSRRKGAQTLELRVEYGLQEVRGIVTMTEQTGKIQVCGYNRKDEKVMGTAEWPGISGPFGKKMKQALQGCELIFWDMELENGEQAKQRAKARMNQRAGNCASMRAVTIGIPELLPGICVELVNGTAESLSGEIYAQEVRHVLDENGYRTIVKGVRL